MWNVLILLLFCEKSEMGELLTVMIASALDFFEHDL